MGLENFNVAPDNKGGRPSKEETEKETEKSEDGAFYVGHKLSPEEYWNQLYDDYVEGEEPDSEEITEMAREAVVLPRTVKSQLAEHGIYTCSGYESVEKVKSSSPDDVEVEQKSGLQGLIQNAK